MNVAVLGGAGELGSSFAKLCIDRGYKVKIIDLTRKLEAWRLNWLGIADKVNYVWKSTFDLEEQDVEADLILDAACQADRPLGTSSPRYTLQNNLLGPLTLLERVSRLPTPDRPTIIYPSSCVEFLGVPRGEQPITERTVPKPTNIYGWSKFASEELYLTYHRAFQLPCMIIRTGSCFGPGMRTDQMVAQVTVKCLRNESILVRSPRATRSYTFTEDVMDFYRLLLDRFESDPAALNGLILSNGGNAENKPYETLEVARMIRELTQSRSELIEGGYEPGELIDGRPVFQWESSELAFKLLGWKPKTTLREGLEKTIRWFKDWKYA
ncbi:MAG: NAD(P)-dependent oxidoreductase [Candidatus Bathyarchaeia archaeon]